MLHRLPVVNLMYVLGSQSIFIGLPDKNHLEVGPRRKKNLLRKGTILRDRGGWVKLNMVQNVGFVCWLASLLILRIAGILSSDVSTNVEGCTVVLQ